jgi:hypothetical protein
MGGDGLAESRQHRGWLRSGGEPELPDAELL